MTIPKLVLYDRNHCDATVLTARLAALQEVRKNLAIRGCTTELFDAAIEEVETLLGEHLPTLPGDRLA